MLQRIRDKITGGRAIALLALIAVPFLFFGINYSFVSQSYAAKVNDVEIPVTELSQAYQAQLSQYQQFGELPAQFRQVLKDNALQGLIQRTLVDEFLRSNNYRVANETVLESIYQIPDFQEEGEFSRETYRLILSNNGLAPSEYEERQRRDLERRQLQEAITETAFVTPEQYRRYINLESEQREVAIAMLDPADLSDLVSVEDAEIETYYDEHAATYMTEESVDFEYAELSRIGVAQALEISEDELLAYYNESRDRFRADEQRQARHILITVEDGDQTAVQDKAKELMVRLEAGEPFADLARQYSKDGGTAAKGGDLGYATQAQLGGALGEAVFSMSPGALRGPVEGDFGVHLIRLDDIRDGGPMPLDQVRDDLLVEMRDKQAGESFFALKNQLSDKLFDADDIATLVADMGIEIKTATNFTRSGGEPFAANQAVIDAVFAEMVIKDGEISDLVEPDADRAIVLKVTEHKAAEQQPLEDVRDTIVATLTSEKTAALTETRGQSLLAGIKDGGDIATLAEEAGADFVGAKAVGRRNADLDPVVVQALFKAAPPGDAQPVVDSVTTPTGQFIVYKLTKILPGRPESVPQEARDNRKQQLARQAGSVEFTAFVAQLQSDADIVVAKDALPDDSNF